MIEKRVTYLLRLARLNIREYPEIRTCPQEGWYVADRRPCVDCESTVQCRWLQRCGDLASLKRQGLLDLDRVLEQATGHVEARARDFGHDSASCQCEACQWLREARSTLAETERVLQALAPGAATLRSNHTATRLTPSSHER